MLTSPPWQIHRVHEIVGDSTVMTLTFLDYPRPHAFAHRGGSAQNPENSWAAFEHAVKLGYAYLETDARATNDGVLLAFHDPDLKRVTGLPGELATMPYRKIASARVHGKERIPLIEDLLGAWPELRFNIDVKHVTSVRPLADVLKRTAAWDRVCVTSFSGTRLRMARAALDRPVCMAVTPKISAALRYARWSSAAMAARIARSGYQCAQIPGWIANPSFIRHAKEVGLHIHVWTLNTKADMDRVLEMGADGIMTDDIILLRELLTERGQWYPR
jgi:glycerophosphoryl diester phosphodiesterase